MYSPEGQIPRKLHATFGQTHTFIGSDVLKAIIRRIRSRQKARRTPCMRSAGSPARARSSTRGPAECTRGGVQYRGVVGSEDLRLGKVRCRHAWLVGEP